MPSLAPLASLTAVGGDLAVSPHVPSNLEGLEARTEIGGSLVIGRGHTDLAGLSALRSIGGDLQIDMAHDLQHVRDLGNLESLGGGLIVTMNQALTSLLGLEGLPAIAGGVELRGNQSLMSLDGLENLQAIGGTLTFGATPGCHPARQPSSPRSTIRPVFRMEGGMHRGPQLHGQPIRLDMSVTVPYCYSTG